MVLWAMEKTMKKFLKSFVLMLALTVSLAAAPAKLPTLKEVEHKSMYAIIMDNGKTGEDRDASGCTAYAISEHVLLTAEHCNQNGGSLYLNPEKIDGHWDRTRPLQVSAKYFDHEDHMLLVVPRATFKYHINYDPDTYAPPKAGDFVYFWGNPNLIHDQYRSGYMMGKMPSAGLDSDVDAGGLIYLFAVPVVGGDSGSSVFSKDGRLVMIVTYGIDNGQVMGGYALAFSSEQIAQAEGRGSVTIAPDTRTIINIMPPAPIDPAPVAPPSSTGPSHRF